MRHPATNKTQSSSASFAFPLSSAEKIMVDSLEVMESYHLEKVALLERTLQELNLMDNAREIAFICSEVVKLKALLSSIDTKKKFLAEWCQTRNKNKPLS